MTRLASLALIAGLLVGCGAASVPWSDYAPGLQSSIDRLATSRDCVALQEQFDVSDANDDATRARTGHGNADLMAYIDAKMRSAGCYD